MEMEMRQRTEQARNLKRLTALEEKKDSMETGIENTVESKMDETIDKLLKNDDQFLEAAQFAVITLVDTEIFIYRIQKKIMETPRVYTKLKDLIYGCITASARH